MDRISFLPESEPLWKAGCGFVVRRLLEKSRDWICQTVALRYRRNSTSEFGFIGNQKYLFPKD